MGKKGNKPLDILAWQWTEKSDSFVSDTDIKSSYRLLLPKCSNCRKNCSANPCCLHSLGSTLWTKSSVKDESEEHLKSIEQELNTDRRTCGELVGLQNLGATCYVNTYLQLWFHNIDFRKAIYALKDHASAGDDGLPQTICGQLQLIFGLLQNSSSKSVDPTSFINCLGLPKDLQQDAQEFSKLFMCLLETTPGLSEVIQSQFSGKYAYVTRCSKCANVVETPAKFYELDLHIQGHKDLKSSIMEFLKEEQLEKDNQYFCDVCLSKQNAVRQIVLKELPPTLSIQLLRFVYDRETQRKHKINTNLSFPEMLDFSTFVTPTEENNKLSTKYYLSAVLLHRGLSASSGHFVAHIKDRTTNSWFQFNDEVVAKMKTGKNLNLDSSITNDNIWNDVVQSPPPKKTKMSKGRHSSKDVYMLVYARKTENLEETPQLPEIIARYVNEANVQFEARIAEDYAIAQQELTEKLELESKMRKLVGLLETDHTVYEWVPTAILKDYLHNGKLTVVEPILTTKFLCSHENLSLNCVNLLKYIPKAAADVIFANSEVYRLNCDLCRKCVYNHCMLLQGKRKLTEDTLLVAEVLKSVENNALQSVDGCYYVGRLSFRKWKFLALKQLNKTYQLKPFDQAVSNDELSSEQPDLEDQFTFNSDLLCLHKNLTTDLNSTLVVSQIIWDILLKYFPDSYVFEVENCIQCSTCYNEVKEKEQAIQHLKLKANEQKNSLHQLYLNKNRPAYSSKIEDTLQEKCSSERYYFVSAEFVDKWRDFVRYPTKYNPVTAVENQIFLCKHDKLLYDLSSYLSIPVELKCDLMQSQPPCVLLWEREWDFIEANFKIDCSICVQKRTIRPCTVVLEKIDESVVSGIKNAFKPEGSNDCELNNNADPSVLIMPNVSGIKNAFEPEGNNNCELNNNADPSVLIMPNAHKHVVKKSQSNIVVDVTITPDLCFECMSGLAVEETRKLRVYEDAEIYVLKSTKTVLEMVQTASCINSDNDSVLSGGHRNNRSRRCARGEKKLGNISSNLTLKQLKLKIMTLFSVPPFDQNLWLNDIFLCDDSASLGSLNIIPGCTITLVADVPNPDDMSFICETSKSEPEVGFLGTNLIGHLGS